MRRVQRLRLAPSMRSSGACGLIHSGFFFGVAVVVAVASGLGERETRGVSVGVGETIAGEGEDTGGVGEGSVFFTKSVLAFSSGSKLQSLTRKTQCSSFCSFASRVLHCSGCWLNSS